MGLETLAPGSPFLLAPLTISVFIPQSRTAAAHTDALLLLPSASMEPFVNFVIRPPRAEYSIDDLLEPEFSIKGRKYQRKDVEIRNNRGHMLQCSHYLPKVLPEETQLPCVIYCHGNSGCRADGNEAALVLLPSNITVFTLDFAGSGLSDGDYVSLGWNERDDLRVVVAYIRSLKQTSCIGLWGRSMGAVTSLIYGAEDPSIGGLVLDSPFSNLFDLMMELVHVYKIRLPKFTIKVALQIMRRIIQKRAQFDIMDLNVSQLASRTFIPALFGHAADDLFILPHHSDLIHQEYAGDKNIIKFDGDHNSPRPQFYYDSVTIFFHNVLSPPAQIFTEDACDNFSYGLGALQIHQDLFEHTVCEALSEPVLSKLGPQDAEDKGILPQSMALGTAAGDEGSKDNLEHSLGAIELIRRANCNGENAELSSLDPLSEMRAREQTGDCCSYPSSNGASTKSWGRCSSQGISENSVEQSPSQQNFSDKASILDDEEKMIMKAIAASLRDQDAILQDTDKVLKPHNSGPMSGGRKCKFEGLSRRFKLNCFKGMGKRNKSTT